MFVLLGFNPFNQVFGFNGEFQTAAYDLITERFNPFNQVFGFNLSS